MESDFKEHPKLVGPHDYWAQVKRTVNGKPVGDADIAMIIAAIRAGLKLREGGSDRLLDLGCGNGALTSLLNECLTSSLGVDYSEFLLEVANRDFAVPGRFVYLHSDVLSFLRSEPSPVRFTKVLIYGCFSYFSAPHDVLVSIRQRFSGVERVFVGNLPDLDCAGQFYLDAVPSEEELRDSESKIGIWRTMHEFEEIASSAGWRSEFARMPSAFYSSHYRYDVILTPA